MTFMLFILSKINFNEASYAPINTYKYNDETEQDTTEGVHKYADIHEKRLFFACCRVFMQF